VLQTLWISWEVSNKWTISDDSSPLSMSQFSIWSSNCVQSRAQRSFFELRGRGYTLRHLCEASSGPNLRTLLEATMTRISSIIDAGSKFEEQCRAMQDVIRSLHASSGASQFEWVDGPLIKAMKSGHWLFDGAYELYPTVYETSFAKNQKAFGFA
jgi:hypothetical protein